LADRCSDALYRTAADVTGREDPGDAGLERKWRPLEWPPIGDLAVLDPIPCSRDQSARNALTA
jgi:hypothetical protein